MHERAYQKMRPLNYFCITENVEKLLPYARKDRQELLFFFAFTYFSV